MNNNDLKIREIEDLIKKNYNIGNIKEINKVLEGASSECFHIITENKEYILKDVEMIFKNHPEDEPLINNILLKRGVCVSEFYKNKENKYLLEYHGHTFHLQSFIRGKILEVNTAPPWFMKESAEILGKIHKALEDIPVLSSGIGKEFFSFITPESAKMSYEKSLQRAIENNESQNIIDLKYRISLLEKIKDIKLEMNKFTYKNTHGDYFISQIICGENSINGIIDFTSACIHPACWEVIRSYSYADPKCIDGTIDFDNLVKYIKDYMKYSSLNKYDIKMMPYLYYYQLAVSDYFSQYYESNNSNKEVLCYYAHWSTIICRWFEKNIGELTENLEKVFGL